MICLALGLGVLGAIAFRRARRCHRGGCGHHGYHGYYGDYGPWDGPGPGHHGRHHRRGRWMIHAMLSRIDATPAQERFIVAEIDKFRDRAYGARANLRDTRSDLAAAMRGPQLDDAALGAVLGRVDTTTGEVRAAALDALRAIHGVLDDRQREQVAELLDKGGAGWWRRGPYR